MIALACISTILLHAAPAVEVVDHRVVVRAGSGETMQSSKEGLWSVAMAWRDDWPAEWCHGQPDQVSQEGPWTVVSGKVETPQGVWETRDAYRVVDCGVVQGVRRYTWRGDAMAHDCTLSVRFEAEGTGPGVVLPGILYHGNPSGARSGRTAVYTGAPGEELFFEEHRFPMPFASLEWNTDGAWHGAALHTLPSPAPFGKLSDQWWSLGVTARDNATEFALLSGPCAANGKHSVIKGVQPGFVPYGQATLDVPPGGIIEKTFWLDPYSVAAEGSGFRKAVSTCLSLYTPYELDGLPTFPEIIEAKARYAASRWHEDGAVAGYSKYHDKPVFVIGWCGQADSLGYASQVLDKSRRDPEALRRAQKSLDFPSGAKFYEGGFHTWYKCDEGRWINHEPLSQGQGMLSFADAIRVGRTNGMDTSKWEDFLKRATAFHADRILADDWNPKSTDEAFFIAPLCKASELFGDAHALDAAKKAGEVYAARHLSMREPYWGGTLDASCEDKEGAFAALQGFLALYETVKEPKYLEWARHACDVALTYTVVWDIPMPPGRLADHAFKTRGWTVVSAQNQHIDVFGVLIAPFIYRVGQLSKSEPLCELALVMYRSCGQLIDPYGSQGEQPQHTNYGQRGEVDDVYALRGGYVEDWTVFWITAHFLNAAARFSEMGVDIGTK